MITSFCCSDTILPDLAETQKPAMALLKHLHLGHGIFDEEVTSDHPEAPIPEPDGDNDVEEDGWGGVVDEEVLRDDPEAPETESAGDDNIAHHDHLETPEHKPARDNDIGEV